MLLLGEENEKGSKRVPKFSRQRLPDLLLRRVAAVATNAPSSYLLPALFLCSLLANLWAVWSVEWLPLGDLGGWIELMDVAARHEDPATLYG